MKRFIVLIVCVLTLSLMCCTAQEHRVDDRKANVHVVVDKTVHDFGKIKPGDGIVTAEYTIKNTGDAPVVIISATASCGCTRPHFTSKPIMPGQTGTISVGYDPKNHAGTIEQTVKVRLSGGDAAKTKRVVLKIKGVVEI